MSSSSWFHQVLQRHSLPEPGTGLLQHSRFCSQLSHPALWFAMLHIYWPQAAEWHFCCNNITNLLHIAFNNKNNKELPCHCLTNVLWTWLVIIRNNSRTQAAVGLKFFLEKLIRVQINANPSAYKCMFYISVCRDKLFAEDCSLQKRGKTDSQWCEEDCRTLLYFGCDNKVG